MINPQMFSFLAVAAVLVFMAGLYGILLAKDLFRAIIAVELLAKAVTLFVIIAGYLVNRVALAQTIAITIIIIEVAVTVVAVGVVLALFKHDKSIDVSILRNLKG